MDKVAVCLLTCDRYNLTRRTVETFALHNLPSEFALYHGDDASTDHRISHMVQSYGFQTVISNKMRKGCHATKRALLEYACKRHEWVLLQENDWEWVRGFPWELFRQTGDAGAWCLRLFGRYKEKGRRACGKEHYKTRIDAGWQPFGEGEIGNIHWCSPPSVCRSDDLLYVLKDTKTEKDGMARIVEKPVVRVVDNCVYHIGETRTPEFKH